MRDVMAAAAEAAATLALAGLLVMVMASTPTMMAVAMITAWRCLSLARCDLRGRGRPAPCASCVPSRAHTRPPSSRWRRSTAASGGALGSETAGFESGAGATRSSPPCSLLHSLLHSLLGTWLVGRWSGAASRSWRRRSFSCLSRSFSSLRIAFSLSSSMPPSSSSEKAGEDGHELGQDWMLRGAGCGGRVGSGLGWEKEGPVRRAGRQAGLRACGRSRPQAREPMLLVLLL